MLRREVFHRDVLPPPGGEPEPGTALEVRWDPLTGHTSRLVFGAAARLAPASDDILPDLAVRTQPDCPFCPDRVEKATPRFPERIAPGGWLSRGEAVVVPNVVAYALHASVGVYGTARHYLPLPDLTQRLVADNLAAQVDFLRRASDADPDAAWTAISANHMLPAGSSLFHPHTQASAHAVPTTMQRLLAECPPERFREYLTAERAAGERWLGGTGRVCWLAGFAPLGTGELRAFVPSVERPERLADADIADLAAGLVAAYQVYAELGFTSFNLAMYGAPVPSYMLNLRLVARSPVAALYRSDATNLERLHWEAAVDLTPEELARRAAARFSRAAS